MVLKANGIVISLKGELLMVGEPVMGVFLKRRGMVTHFPARLINWPLLSEQSSRGNDLAGKSTDPFLPARRFVLCRAMSEERDIFG
jgi:hypothetical protein